MALSFFCRIRPPIQIELLTSTVQKSDHSKSPANRCRTPIKNKPSSLSKDCMFNIFTCANQRNSKIVIASENPIKSKLIDCYIKSEEDLENYRESILENIEIFKFDKVFALPTNQLQLFNETCKENINQIFKGIDSNIIIYGPNSSGKDYCLRGLENKESGLVIQTVEALLSLIEISKQSCTSPSTTTSRDKTANQFIVTTSIVAVINDEGFDVLVPKPKRLAFIDDHSNHSVRFISEFKNLYRTALNNLKALEKNEMRHKSHLFISIQLNKNEYRDNIIGKINFIRLGDADEPELARDFNELANYLKEIKFHCKKEKKKDFEGRLFLKYLNENVKENSLNTLLTLVSGNNQLYKQSMRALKFSSNIFEYSKSQKSNVPYDLIKKINFQYNQIENFTNMAKNLSNQQCMDWITDKEYELFSLEKEINNAEQICNDEEFVKKAHVFYELYSFLKKIKEKAIYQIDNLSNLISKYHSKKKQNSEIPKAKERALSQEIKERDLNIPEDFEQDLTHLKNNIMKKIDETIGNSPIGLTNRLNEKEKELKEKHDSFAFENKHENKLDYNNIADVNLIRANAKLKKKLKKRKHIISNLSEELKFKETKFLEEKLLSDNYIRELEEKNLNLRNYIESLETKRTTHEEMNEFQKGYHSGLLKEMKEKLEKENIINEGLKKEKEMLWEKNEILEQNLNKLEKKIKKNIEWFEGERKVLALENQKEVHEKQMEFEIILEKQNFQNNELKGNFENDKIEFSERISNLEGFIEKLRDENNDLVKMQSTYLEEVDFLKEELEEIRKSKKELSESCKENSEKFSILDSKNKVAVKCIEKLTDEKENLEKLVEEENNYNKELQDKYELLVKESKIQRDYNVKLEAELEYIKIEQNKEFEELAKKLDEFVVENRAIIEENDNIKQTEIELKNELSHLLKDQDKLLSENEKISNKNDQLKKCLQTMEAKIKEFIEEKKIQVKTLNKSCKENVEQNGNVLIEKLKILEEIEEIVRNQRSPQKFK